MRGIKYYLTGAVVAVAAFVGVNNFYSTTNASDCSDNSVVRCGVSSVSDMRKQYNENSRGTKSIYSHLGVTSDMVNNAKVVNGLVHKNGTVTVSGKTVAKSAVTAGRQYIPGSTKVTAGSTTFYTRTPSVSFVSSSLAAYVFTDKDGRFLGAVIKECGNPVKATNTVTPPSNPKVNIEKKVLTDKDLKDPKEEGIVGEDNRFAYRIIVKNTGDVTLKNSVVTDKAPKGVTFTGAKNGTVKSNVFTNTIASLKPGEQVSMYVYAVAKEQFLKKVENVACVDIKEKSGSQDDCDSAWVRTHDRKVTIEKVVNGKEHDTVEVNKPFTYTLVVKNHGDVDLKDVKVSDNAPEGIVFTKADKGTVSSDGKKWSMTIAKLEKDAQVRINITAKATKQLSNTKNTACVDAPVTEENPDDCDDATVETPKPVYVCKDLTVATISRTEFKFTATKEVKNAEYVKTVFRVTNASGAVVATLDSTSGVTNFTQTNPGTYTVQAEIVVRVNGELKTAGGANCKETFKVKPAPVYTCDSLTARKINRTTATFAGEATAKNGASIKSYTFNYGDGQSDTTTTPSARHSYANPGTYNVSMSVTFVVNGKEVTVSGPNCKTTVTVDEKPVEPNPGVKIDKTVVTADGETDETTVEVNTPYDYRVTVTNNGDVNLVNTVVSDQAPAGVTLLSASEGTVSADGTSWTATINLAVGESKSFTLTAKVVEYVEGALVNTACVDAAEVSNPNTSTDDCDDATVTVEEPEPVLVEACNTETGEIEKVEEGNANTSPYTTDLTQCDEPGQEEEMCPVPGKEDLPADSEDCAEDEVPTELPKTGLSGAVLMTLGLGALTAAGAYATRRNS